MNVKKLWRPKKKYTKNNSVEANDNVGNVENPPQSNQTGIKNPTMRDPIPKMTISTKNAVNPTTEVVNPTKKIIKPTKNVVNSATNVGGSQGRVFNRKKS